MMNIRNAIQFSSWLCLMLGLGMGLWLLNHSPDAPSVETTGPVTLVSISHRLPASTVYQSGQTRPIESIRVGDRVMARNPEFSESERVLFANEPDWSQWAQLSLEMPKQDGSTLHIEMLRPKSWVLSELQYLIKSQKPSALPPQKVVAETSVVDEDPEGQLESWFSSLSPIEQQIWLTSLQADANGYDLVSVVINLQLPELGADGWALLTGVKSVPGHLLHPGERETGQVVTATFRHPPSTAVLDVRFEGEADPIGVTNNHPFWSVDQQEFVEIGKLSVGTRVLTFHGETRRIASRLPRPGPATVYNLEVRGEHVYFVGTDCLLAHNMCAQAKLDNRTMTKAEWKVFRSRQRLDARRGKSSYKERLDRTPISNGSWSGPRGESVFTSTNPVVFSLKVQYENGYADLTSHAKYAIKIKNLVFKAKLKKNPRYDLHSEADEILADELGVAPHVIRKFRKQNKFTWHEVEDMETLQLVPTVVNAKFGHLGGIGEALRE